MNKKVYQQDIADSLGISKNAVSRALRGCSDISQATIEKVKQKANELGYIPNNISTYLSSGKVKLFSIIVYNLKNVYFSLMADLLIKKIEAQGYKAIISAIQLPIIDIDVMKEILATQCAGVFSLINVDDEAIKLCEKNNVPLSLIGNYNANPYVSCFTADDYQGSRLIGEKLLELGAKKPCFLYPLGEGIAQNRQLGIEEVFKENNGPKLDLYYASYDNDIYNIFAKNVKKNKNDFIVAYSDEIAINVKRILNFPYEQVFGFDGIHKRLPIISTVNGLSNDWDSEVNDVVDDMFIKINNPYKPTSLKKLYKLSL